MNLIVFLSFEIFRKNSCTFYLIAMSFCNIIHLLVNLLSHILSIGFEVDSLTDMFVCLQISNVSHYIIYLSLFSNLFQFTLASMVSNQICSIYPVWFCLLHTVPFFVFYNSTELECFVTNLIFAEYLIFGYIFVLTGVLPLVTMVVFGLLAYYNVRNLAYRTIPLVRRELDKQLTQMVLVLTPFVIVTLLIFIFPTNKILNFLQIIFIIVHNIHFAVRNQILPEAPVVLTIEN